MTGMRQIVPIKKECTMASVSVPYGFETSDSGRVAYGPTLWRVEARLYVNKFGQKLSAIGRLVAVELDRRRSGVVLILIDGGLEEAQDRARQHRESRTRATDAIADGIFSALSALYSRKEGAA